MRRRRRRCARIAASIPGGYGRPGRRRRPARATRSSTRGRSRATRASATAPRSPPRSAAGSPPAFGTRRRSGVDLLYVAVPIASSGKILGAARITYPTSTVDRRVRRYWLTLRRSPGIVLAGVTLVGVWLARGVARPLRRVEEAAAEIGAGHLDARAPEEGPPEVRRLAQELNETARKLQQLLESQQAFVADASHELRTPLTALRLRLENIDPCGGGTLARGGRSARPARRSATGVGARGRCDGWNRGGGRRRSPLRPSGGADRGSRSGRAVACACGARPTGSARSSTTSSRTHSRCRTPGHVCVSDERMDGGARRRPRSGADCRGA